MSDPQVSFVIPSMRDRREDLLRCLAALVRETEGIAGEALPVVEDAEAAAGLRACGAGSLHVRPVLRPGGAARRRNAGWAEARGRVIACLDDDAEPQPGYGAALVARFADDGPLLVQGAVWPAFETQPAAALEPVLFSLGGFNRHGDRRREDVFISANCAFHREVLDRVGPMREDLGPGSTGVPWGDDTEWCRRAARAGIRPVFDDAISVRHRIQADRVTEAALLRRAVRVGRTRARLEWDGRRPGAGVLWHQRALALWAAMRSRRSIEARLAAARHSGYADEIARIRAGLPPGD